MMVAKSRKNKPIVPVFTFTQKDILRINLPCHIVMTNFPSEPVSEKHGIRFKCNLILEASQLKQSSLVHTLELPLNHGDCFECTLLLGCFGTGLPFMFMNCAPHARVWAKIAVTAVAVLNHAKLVTWGHFHRSPRELSHILLGLRSLQSRLKCLSAFLKVQRVVFPTRVSVSP